MERDFSMKIKFNLDKERNPEIEDGMKVMYGPDKRNKYKIRWYFILILVISPLFIMAYYLFRTQILVISPGIITSYPLTINSEQPAIVEGIFLESGDDVNKEQILIKLKNYTLNKEIDFIKKEIHKLSNLKITNNDNIHRNAIKNTEISAYKVYEIQKKYDQYKQKGHISDIDYATIVNLKNAIDSQLSDQQIIYNDDKFNKDQIRVAGPVAQQYRNLMQQLVIKETQKESLYFKSPFNGRVLDIHVQNGQRIQTGTPLVTISQNVTPQVVAFLEPKHLEYSAINTKAKVIFPDGKKFTATVFKPVEVVNKLPQELQNPFEGQSGYLKLTLAFDNAIDKIRWVEGVEVEVKF